MSALLLSKHL